MICRFRNSILIWPCSCYRGAVIWNVIGRANGSILECTHVKSSWKNFLNCHTFKDFNFNFSAPQIINNRSENFIYFWLLTQFYWTISLISTSCSKCLCRPFLYQKLIAINRKSITYKGWDILCVEVVGIYRNDEGLNRINQTIDFYSTIITRALRLQQSDVTLPEWADMSILI